MPEQGLVLFVDDEALMREAVTQWLGLAGFELLVHERAASARDILSADFPGILVTDLKMEGLGGMELLAHAQTLDPTLPVIVITGHGDIETAVEAMRLGAYDFIEKPFAPERFLDTVRRAIEKRQLVMENRRLRRSAYEQDLQSRIIGTSRAAEMLRASVAEMAATDVSVILYGETGVGKDLVGRCLHDFGRRVKGHFVAVNCAAVPETMVESEFFGVEAGAFTGALRTRPGKLEHASGGTLFLDEIDSMPLAMQGKMLRALQERSLERLGSNTTIAVDLRPIAASKIDLRAAAEDGSFRLDLYYRLSVAELEIPPLRARREDIPLLFEHFVAAAAQAHGREAVPVAPSVLNALMAHDWPGNVRELRNAAERHAVGLAPRVAMRVTAEPAPQSLAQQVEAYEKMIIERALNEADGKISAVMERLDVPRRTLSEKIAKHGIARKRGTGTHRPDSAHDDPDIGGKPPAA